MDRVGMREWVASLEEMIDNKLRLWKKFNPVEDKDLVNLEWQFENTHMILNISWPDGREMATLHCIGPVNCHRYVYFGLSDKTFNQIADRIGNLAQVIMHPPIDPMDPPAMLHGFDE